MCFDVLPTGPGPNGEGAEDDDDDISPLDEDGSDLKPGIFIIKSALGMCRNLLSGKGVMLWKAYSRSPFFQQLMLLAFQSFLSQFDLT